MYQLLMKIVFIRTIYICLSSCLEKSNNKIRGKFRSNSWKIKGKCFSFFQSFYVNDAAFITTSQEDVNNTIILLVKHYKRFWLTIHTRNKLKKIQNRIHLHLSSRLLTYQSRQKRSFDCWWKIHLIMQKIPIPRLENHDGPKMLHWHRKSHPESPAPFLFPQ